ncbi:MAG: hypothetical protein ACTTKC_11445 [Treponema sp.]|uniref:hypothetical protein n=1 Tax=Treponema sp. TaxID=166 RepID=UPI003FA1F380
MDRWFKNELIAEWNKNVRIEEIQSINGPIHIEVYKTDNINNPTLVFSHGNFTWNEHLVNLKDTVEYARKNFTGKVFLGGASMGGPLAYACDARYNLANGLICWCLWDFSDKEFMCKETNTKKMTFVLLPIFKLLSKLIGKIRLNLQKSCRPHVYLYISTE